MRNPESKLPFYGAIAAAAVMGVGSIVLRQSPENDTASPQTPVEAPTTTAAAEATMGAELTVEQLEAKNEALAQEIADEVKNIYQEYLQRGQNESPVLSTEIARDVDGVEGLDIWTVSIPGVGTVDAVYRPGDDKPGVNEFPSFDNVEGMLLQGYYSRFDVRINKYDETGEFTAAESPISFGDLGYPDGTPIIDSEGSIELAERVLGIALSGVAENLNLQQDISGSTASN